MTDTAVETPVATEGVPCPPRGTPVRFRATDHGGETVRGWISKGPLDWQTAEQATARVRCARCQRHHHPRVADLLEGTREVQVHLFMQVPLDVTGEQLEQWLTSVIVQAEEPQTIPNDGGDPGEFASSDVRADLYVDGVPLSG